MKTPKPQTPDVRQAYRTGGRAALHEAPVEDYAPPEPPKPEERKPRFQTFQPNDLGRADYFAELCAAEVKFCRGMGWLLWDGERWNRDESGSIIQIAGAVARQALSDAAEIQVDELRAAKVREALAFANRKRLLDMLALAESHPKIAISPSDTDTAPITVGVLNGAVNLRTGQFLEPRRETIITRSLGVEYDARATCPRWEAFVSEIMAEDAELIQFFQRAIGYSLTGSMDEQVFFFCHGSGANGKSVAMDTLRTLLGSYASRASESLLESRSQKKDPQVELAELPGRRALFASETAQGARLNERLLKDLTGGEFLRAEAKYQDGFHFAPECKIWISGNYPPMIGGTDNGIWRRVRLIPFTVTFPSEKQDRHLAEKLKAELPGILNWAIRGAVEWAAEGLGLPEAVRHAVDDYRADQDVLGEFLAETVEEAVGFNLLKQELFKAYQTWAEFSGMKHPLSAKQLSRQLKARGMNDLGGRYWRDWRLAADS